MNSSQQILCAFFWEACFFLGNGRASLALPNSPEKLLAWSWFEENSQSQRPDGVLDSRDGYVATYTATVTFTCILVQGGGPPRDKLPRSPGDPGFRCQIIPELVWPYSRTRLALFPNSFPLVPKSFGLFLNSSRLFNRKSSQHVPNLAPKVEPKMIKKIDAKIDQNFDAS